MSSNSPVQDLSLLKQSLSLNLEKNLTTLKQHFPELHTRFVNYQPQNFWLELDPRGFLNIKGPGGFLFNEDPKTTSHQQINEFKVAPHRTLYQARSIDDADNNKHGFIHLSLINKLIQKGETLIEDTVSSTIDGEFYPSLIVMGNGLGFHLELLVNENIGHIHIVEPIEDFFYASLLAVDYSSLIQRFSVNGKHISIEVGSTPQQFIKNLHFWIRELGQYRAGALPLLNHYVSPDIQESMKLFFDAATQYHSGFGFFEDELLAVEHTIKNLANGAKLLNDIEINGEVTERPVFICGNGPSLDLNLEYLKAHHKNLVVVSCGSAIYPLYKAGITPDIHFEIERTKDVASWIALIEDPAFFKAVPLVASNNVAPDVLALFANSYLFLKPDDMGSKFIEKLAPEQFNKTMNLKASNPLVGNGALSFLLAAGFKNLYLVGLDVGYRKLDHHHSKESAYYTEFDGEFATVKAQDKKVPGNFGSEVYTETVYDYSRHALEWLLAQPEYRNIKCFNCSDGALIRGAVPLHLDTFSYAEHDTPKNLESLLAAMAVDTNLSKKQMTTGLLAMQGELFALIDKLFIDLKQVNDSSVEQLCLVFNWQFEQIKAKNTELAGILLQNSINHFQTIALGQLHLMKSQDARAEYVQVVYSFMKDYFIEMKSRFAHQLFDALNELS